MIAIAALCLTVWAAWVIALLLILSRPSPHRGPPWLP